MRRKHFLWRLSITCLFLLGVSGRVFSEETKHIMKEGDTLYSVSRLYKVPLESLMKANNISNPAKLQRGATLLIPDLYEVKKGDTVYGIAKHFGLTVSSLLALNNLKEGFLLKPGINLYIPRKSSSPETKAVVLADKKPEEKPLAKPSAAPAKVPAVETNHFWPHPGPKKNLDGKLEGLSFEGRPGDEVFAVSAGKVVWVGPYRGFGRVVFIQSDAGFIYVYAGNEELFASVGDQVVKGQKLGKLGVHPYEQKSNLYFIVYKDGKAIDPENAPRI